MSRAEIFFGKALGSGLAVTAALAAGFGLAALALASLGLGFVISTLTRKSATAMGAAGQFAAYRFGAALPLLLTGLMLAWIVLSFGSAFSLFNRRGD